MTKKQGLKARASAVRRVGAAAKVAMIASLAMGPTVGFAEDMAIDLSKWSPD